MHLFLNNPKQKKPFLYPFFISFLSRKEGSRQSGILRYCHYKDDSKSCAFNKFVSLFHIIRHFQKDENRKRNYKDIKDAKKCS